MSEPVIQTEIDPRGIATLRLNRPEVNNAYNGEVLAALQERAETLGGDAAVRAIIVRGNGRHFQAGADLKWIEENRNKSLEENLEVSRTTRKAFFGLLMCPKPIVALVHGGCFGGGTGIVSSCDIVIAEETAVFAITEARWGLVPTMIMPQLMSRLGPARTRRYSLTCERFDAKRAFKIGFVDEVCAEGKLDEAAAPTVDALLHCSPVTLAQLKADAIRFAGLNFTEEEFEELAQGHAKLRYTDEAEEGVKSFLEKRKPSWYPGQ